jgi:hypothetical protein
MVKIVATHLRAQGFAVLPYMDDGGYGEITFVLAVLFRNYVVTLWESLGLRFSATDGKCLPTPTQSTELLGVCAHLAAKCPSFHMPPRKVKLYLKETGSMLDMPCLWEARKIARVAGLLMSAALAMPVSKRMCRPLFECMYGGDPAKTKTRRSDSQVAKDWTALIQGSPDARHELQWLLDNMVVENERGAPIWLDPGLTLVTVVHADRVLSQDSSRRAAGWAVHMPDDVAFALLPRPISLSHLRIMCWEYCSGSGSGVSAFLRAHRDNPAAVAVLVDVIPRVQALRFICPRLVASGRVLYYQCIGDVILDPPAFDALVHATWPGYSVTCVVKIVVAPPCTTLSCAARFIDSEGREGHPSRPNGVNGPGRRPEALAADAFRTRLTVMIRDLVDQLPDGLRVYFENPAGGLYRHTEDARLLLDHTPATGRRWKLVTLPHCLFADDDEITANKPSDYIMYGFHDIPSQLCTGQCRFCIPNTRLHRWVISNASRHPEQRRLEGALRQRIPLGVHDHLDTFAVDIAPLPADPPFLHTAIATGTVRFCQRESTMHQAALELFGLAMAFRAAAVRTDMRGKRFRVRVDATVTVSYFRNSGGRSPLMNRLYRLLWTQLRALGSTIVEMVHVPGVQFVAEGTDQLSRPPQAPLNSVPDRDEWRVTRLWFERIQEWAREDFVVDLFADRDNHRLPAFYAPCGCAEALGQPDAFANVWPVGLHYAFPPLGLVPRLLQLVHDVDADVVLLVPDWPSQHWWPRLMAMTTSSWFVGRLPDVFERRADVGGVWGYHPVRKPFFELRICRVKPSVAAALTFATPCKSSGIRLLADAASASTGAVPPVPLRRSTQ